MLSESLEELEQSQLARCQELLDYQFEDESLLVRCLTHASSSRTRLESNERLEFLGDAILGMVVCELLYEEFPSSSEGELTRIKSVVVSRATCARMIQDLHLQPFLILGKGIAAHSHIPGSILATAFEALVGGIYLDGGFEAARTFIRRVIAADVTGAAESAIGVNYKSLFQQRTQRMYGETPAYHVLDEKGPDHSKSFLVRAVVGSKSFTAAWGASKKTAEQHAAHNALCELDGEPLPFPLAEEAEVATSETVLNGQED